MLLTGRKVEEKGLVWGGRINHKRNIRTQRSQKYQQPVTRPTKNLTPKSQLLLVDRQAHQSAAAEGGFTGKKRKQVPTEASGNTTICTSTYMFCIPRHPNPRLLHAHLVCGWVAGADKTCNSSMSNASSHNPAHFLSPRPKSPCAPSQHSTFRPASGLAPQPRPSVTLFPSCSRLSVSVVDRCCASVLHTMNSTPLRLRAIILLTVWDRQEGGRERGREGRSAWGGENWTREEGRVELHGVHPQVPKRPNSCSGFTCIYV